MERLLLVISTFCFLFGFGYTMHALGARVYQPSRLNLFAMLSGFVFQTAFLYLRGQQVGRCPLTSLFEVLIFLSWSLVLFYLLIGPAYRLSLLGAFTSPLVFLFQMGALLLVKDTPVRAVARVNSWLELHAAVSVVAYGAFALASVAGCMYLVQERQLKTRRLHSTFQHLPPLHDLFAVITRLLWAGFALYTAGLISGFFTGQPLPRAKMICALAVWLLYAAVLHGRHLRRLAPKRVAALCILAFSAAVTVLWGITFVSETHPL